MQEFTSDAGRHSFTFDGRKFYVPSPSIGDVGKISALADLKTNEEQALGMREILVASAAPAKRTFWEWLTNKNPAPAVIDALGLPQTTKLFKAWMGSMSEDSAGESSGSAE